MSWSDAIIAESDVAEEPFIALSFSGTAHPLTVLSLLESLSAQIDTLEVLPAVLGIAYKRLAADPEYGPLLSRALYRIYVDNRNDVPPQLRQMAWFDDAYDLASAGIAGTVEGVYAQLLQFTKQFELPTDLASAPKTGSPPARG